MFMLPFTPVVVQHYLSGEVLLIANLTKWEKPGLAGKKQISFFFDDTYHWITENNSTVPVTFRIERYEEDAITGGVLILGNYLEKDNECYLGPFSSVTSDMTFLHRLETFMQYSSGCSELIQHHPTLSESFTASIRPYSGMESDSDAVISYEYMRFRKEAAESFITFMGFLADNHFSLQHILAYLRKHRQELSH